MSQQKQKLGSVTTTRYRLVVMTNAVDGRNEDLAAWYRNGHIDDMLAIPGILSADWLTLVGHGPYRNLVMFEIETGDIEALLEECYRRDGTPEMPSSDALDRSDIFSSVFQTA